MGVILLNDLRKLLDFEQVVDLHKEEKQVKCDTERVYLGSYEKKYIYDENLAY